MGIQDQEVVPQSYMMSCLNGDSDTCCVSTLGGPLLAGQLTPTSTVILATCVESWTATSQLGLGSYAQLPMVRCFGNNSGFGFFQRLWFSSASWEEIFSISRQIRYKKKQEERNRERVNFIINTTLYRSTEGKKIIIFLKKVRACKLSPDSQVDLLKIIL